MYPLGHGVRGGVLGGSRAGSEERETAVARRGKAAVAGFFSGTSFLKVAGRW